jgi:hypothetical protein
VAGTNKLGPGIGIRAVPSRRVPATAAREAAPLVRGAAPVRQTAARARQTETGTAGGPQKALAPSATPAVMTFPGGPPVARRIP